MWLANTIAIGSATDIPYQPAEREFGVTRAVLERLCERQGLSVSITTKSDQVVRDIDLLKRISRDRRSPICNDVLRCALDWRECWNRALLGRICDCGGAKLREAGIAAGVFMMPVLPGLTDSDPHFERDGFHAAKIADAQWFAAVRAFSDAFRRRKNFWPFIEENFPRLAKRYSEFYSHAGVRARRIPARSYGAVCTRFARNTDWETGRKRRFARIVIRNFRFHLATRNCRFRLRSRIQFANRIRLHNEISTL